MLRSRLSTTRPLAGAGAFALASGAMIAPVPPAVNAAAPAAPRAATEQAPAASIVQGPVPRQATSSEPAAPVQRRLVVFGDSVANRPSCGCPTFVSRYVQLVRDHAEVRVDNLAGDGQTTASVLDVLAEPQTRRLVAAADTVVFVAGANDFHHAFAEVGAGRWSSAAYRAVARGVQANLVKAIRTVAGINPRARVITFGYWNAFKDGAVARTTYTPQQRRAAEEATVAANDAIRRAADATDSSYLSSRQAFAAAGRITPLLASDGDHPSAAGNDVLAHTLADAIWVK